MRFLWKFILRTVAFSFAAVLCVTMIAYLLNLRWFMAVGSVVCLTILWTSAIMNYDDGSGEKTKMEAMNMLGMKKKNIDILNPMRVPIPVKANESSVYLDLEVPTPPSTMKSNGELISEEDKVTLKIKGLKAELENINVQMIALQENIGKLEELYNTKKKAINDQLMVLDEARREIKDKILELI